MSLHTHWVVCFGLLLYCVWVDTHADIKFEKAQVDVGIVGGGSSYGASWGDFNGDGFPDLWVGNHDKPPSLYVNSTNGRFSQILAPSQDDSVLDLARNADLHGAAWADFDEDGDQDLAIAVDARYEGQALIETLGSDVLLENRSGRLTSASEQSISIGSRASRQPLWLDADIDGDLDLLLVGKPSSQGNKQNNVLFLQDENHRFVNSNFDLSTRRTSRTDRYIAYTLNMLSGHFWFPVDTSVTPHQESAQLVDLNHDRQLDLLILNKPSRVYQVGQLPFAEITYQVGLPEVGDVLDMVVEDFDLDGFNDLVVARGPYRSSDVVQKGNREIHATLLGHSNNKASEQAKGFNIAGAENITISLAPSWFSLENLKLAGQDRAFESRTLSLSTKDLSPITDEDLQAGKLVIGYDPIAAVWQIRNGVIWQHVDLIIRADSPIEIAELYDLTPFKATGSISYYSGTTDEFLERTALISNASCFSLVAEDFDNDMDLDVYAVCSGPIENRANLLFENVGKGEFRQVNFAGGARGSDLGRGDVVASADFDNDGDVDLFVANGADPTSPFVEQGPHELFVNVSASGNWLLIKLRGESSNAEGIGAIVEVSAGGVVQRRSQTGGMHRFTQNSTALHFGLAENDQVDKVVVLWPSGAVTELTDVQANQKLLVTEGT